jgi:chromosome segregation ATPase
MKRSSRPEYEPGCQPRIDKAMQWLETSRDTWKEKAKESKGELNKKKLAVKRARESRDALGHQLVEAQRVHQEVQKALEQKEKEAVALREQLEAAHQQILELKKKR